MKRYYFPKQRITTGKFTLQITTGGSVYHDLVSCITILTPGEGYINLKNWSGEWKG